MAWLTLNDSSWRRRGTLMAHPLSRKYRLSSPTIVGVAYVVNSTARSMSKRSIALIRPIVPTWMRSSMGSPRFLKRLARYFTRLRYISTSSSRAASSPSARYRTNSSRVSCLSHTSLRVVFLVRREVGTSLDRLLHQAQEARAVMGEHLELVTDRLEDEARITLPRVAARVVRALLGQRPHEQVEALGLGVEGEGHLAVRHVLGGEHERLFHR